MPQHIDDLLLDEAPGWALFLDFDGTLVDLAPRPDAITVPEGLPILLTQLRDLLGGALAVVSGRPIAELDRFLSPAQLAAAGQHGLERRDADGRHRVAPVDQRALAAIAASMDGLAARHPGVRVERKSLSVALHYREAPAATEAARQLAEELGRAHASAFQVQAGKMVFELKPRGADKGAAVAAFMAESPFAGRRPVFAGDDLTDEYGFAAATAAAGIAIQVGRREPNGAGWNAQDPQAFRGWLEKLARHIGSTAS
ncbi:trehalose-phosphatase [Arenibaculum pallidiluteum]|uniref:trehalose-phosphatase n=1 Tax=Arenibaculum pallidiluteum TaxID=2812559 RepID=UPI001A96FCDB|nr:trehalose-phosphatase [Arenibaculum pallidiluteum]